MNRILLFCCLTATTLAIVSADQPPPYQDPQPQRYTIGMRSSQIDPRVKAYPEINFLIETKRGRPVDRQQAIVDTSVPPRGRLVIWLMGYNQALFERLADYGLHAIQVHYARQWFSICCQGTPVDADCRGNMRLEAATGQDFSDEVAIAPADSIAGRAFAMVRALHEQNPPGNWDQFLNESGDDLDWDKVILSGASHGATTAARFAKHQRVARVVCFCGPRDQYQRWQSLPSETPENRYFGFSHVLDGGWVGDHYCRSWELMGLHRFGPIVNVDHSEPPFANTRRLITDFDVGGNAKRAHSGVVPGGSACRDRKTKQFKHEAVWRYLFTHPVDQVGDPVPMDDSCNKNQVDR